MIKKIVSFALAAAIALSIVPAALAYDEKEAEIAVKDAVTAIKPESPALGSEWLIVADNTYKFCGLGESYGKLYYNGIKALLDENDGGLGVNRITEYEKVIIALTALGYDASNIGGYDLLGNIADYNAVKRQGVNSVIYALLALDSGCYDMPEAADGAEQNSRKKMVDNILSRETEGGGFALYGKVADSDITAMALQALSKYTYRSDVKAAVERAVAKLSAMQLPDGSFASLSGKSDVGTAESTAQVLLALSALGISPDDPRFVKEKSIMDGLLDFRFSDGSFKHIKTDEKGDNLASVQSVHAICAAARTAESGVPAYVFANTGDARFADVIYNDHRAEIEKLAEVGIIDGMTDSLFVPDATMTRAQFAAIVVRTLGLEKKAVDVFADVPEGAWYSGVVGAAFSAGIIQGRSDTVFDPEGTITDAEAFVMLSRAARILKLTNEEYQWYASDYRITRGEVAEAVYMLYSRMA